MNFLHNAAMEIDDHHYEKVLLHFATLFLLLGVIERRLRVRIPATLSEYGLLINRAPWWLVPPHREVQHLRIQRAIRKNDGLLENFERYLTLRFWREIFRGKCYRTLWIPALHDVFSGLERPLDSRSYGRVAYHLDQAVEIRNRVAHFDETKMKDFKREEEMMLWLVNALGGLSSKG